MIDGDILFSFAGGDERHIDFLPEKCQSDFFFYIIRTRTLRLMTFDLSITSFINFLLTTQPSWIIVRIR